ncbi:MAG: D-alanine--D-alanine ligase [Clostridia bacterium]|nr:D-alanine--D-alanine ligase [Clostridia bacterium]
MKVILLFGGAGEEYEISLRSAAAVLAAFPREHTLTAVGIDREGRWYRTPATPAAVAADAWREGAVPVTLDLHRRALVAEGQVIPADVVFPLLHGGLGEGGGVAALLSLLSIPFVGCGLTAGAVGMDKVLTKQLAATAGIPTAAFTVVTEEDLTDAALGRRLGETLGFPFFVKPATGGSSVGAACVATAAEAPAALRAALAHSDRALCEEYIRGAEVELALLERAGALLTTAVGEIEPAALFYDYAAKYESHASRIFIPARVSRSARESVTAYGRRLFRLLGCRGLSRADFFVAEDGRVLLNEINTMPGFTDISMFPRLWQAAGLSMTELINVLLENAAK